MIKLPVLGEGPFRQLKQMMHDASGILLADNKRTLVAGRLLKRLRHHQLDTYEQYLALVFDQAQERRLVIDLLTTNETYFFREYPHFDYLGQWLERQRAPQRLWSAACSTGEEAYSLAMVAAEQAAGDWSVLGTDLSQTVLATAEQGIYDIAQSRYFPEGALQRHCLCGIGQMHGRMRVQSQLRGRVAFREVNLAQHLPADLGSFDVIFLRNLLIYFEPAQKLQIVRRLCDKLRSGGLLFIGHAESIHGFDLPLRLVQPSVFERQ
jgi:chemotaxis protein methyltransferase CheR